MDEIERDHLRLIPGVFTFQSRQEKAFGSMKLNWTRPDVTLLASDGLTVGHSFGNLRSYSHNERSRFFQPVKSCSRAQ